MLNIYFIKDWVNSWGICNNPESHANDPQPGKLDFDGCVIRHSTVPGGPLSTYGEGKTMLHEVGHWFGLWHTFEMHDYEDGCNPVGDMVDERRGRKKPIRATAGIIAIRAQTRTSPRKTTLRTRIVIPWDVL